jgi:ribulose-bisphosphate carboxylase small chain
MRITQGTFSFLPDLGEEQIDAQVRYALEQGWAVSVEHTDDPHPRNPYWTMWGHPLFDLRPEESEAVMREVRECREARPNEYVKVIAYDSSRGRQTTRLSFIVGRPPFEPGFQVSRTDAQDRVIRYRLHPYETDKPAGRRYRQDGVVGNGAAATGVEALPGMAGGAVVRPVGDENAGELA